MKLFRNAGRFCAGLITILSLIPPPPVFALQPPGSAAGDDAAGAARPFYRTVRIFVPDRDFLSRIWSAGLDFEGATGKPGGWMEFIASPSDVGELTARGIRFEITDNDPAGTLAHRLSAAPVDAMGFGTGSMGGYYTLAEVEGQLDSMALLHPEIVTGKQAVGYTVEGRTVWGVKISDNPGTDEENEPEILYTALIHAREPAGMMTTLYYMWWLVGNYGNDPRATYLVNNRQIWFIPVVNPDGYAYNESTNPSGGGLWRKNRRNNGDGTFGIDLNRNFGPDVMWNAPNGGSSTTPGSSTYRGPFPFSEPETVTFDVFMRLHEIRTCFNYHAHGRLLIYPYGYLSSESEDSLVFREFAYDLTRVNRHASGTDQQTVNYSTRGNSDDFMYGDTTKYRTFAMTPEVGSSFWPATEQILPIAVENLEANIHYSMVAGAMPVIDRRGPTDTTLVPLVPGDPFTVPLRVRNKGLSPTPPLTISLATDSGFLTFDDPAPGIPPVPPMGDTTILVAGTVRPDAPAGRSFRLITEITSTDGYLRRDSSVFYTGEPILLFADDAESGTALWSVAGTWGTVGSSHGGISAFHDSPAGNSTPSSNTTLRTASPINLSGVEAAVLRFWTRWEIEPTFDFGTVDVSTDGGIIWQTLPAPLSHIASGYGTQTAGTWGFDGYTPGLTWIQQEIDLTPFAGGQVLLQFRMATDGSDGRDGWYLDDIAVHGFRDRIPGSVVGVSASASTPVLFFGEWPGATDGIDSSLGEFPLPPPPGPDTFDVRWRLPGGEWSTTDIRDTLPPGSGPVIFTLTIGGVAGEYPVTISWDRSLLPAGGWRVRDSATSGGIVMADMWLTDHILVPDANITALEFMHTTDDSALFPVARSWNLVSLPVDPPDHSVESLFPGASPVAYAFGTEYVQTDSLFPGTGYWIRDSAGGEITAAGVPHVETRVTNTTGGWVLFGTVYCPVARTDLCPGCLTTPVVYGYQNGYFIPDTLYPGMGYWYHGANELDLDCATGGSTLVKNGLSNPLEGFDVIKVADESGATATLFAVSGEFPMESDIMDYPAPPPPPQSAFDARFENQQMVEYFTVGSDRKGKNILITNPRGDLNILYLPADRSNNTATTGYRVGIRGDGVGTRLEAGVPLRLPLPGGGVVRLSAADERPAVFRMYRNYPNPFNPQTTLRFDLPADAAVTLGVKNITGQEVDVPFSDRPMSAGTHSVTYDASELASGVYFYMLTAVENSTGRAWRSTGKFLLIR